MSRIFLVAISVSILFGSAPLWAQPDFTQSDVYQVGDDGDYLALDATNADPGPAGNGVTWDFSDLPRTPDGDFTVFYRDPGTAPNGNQFPEANLVAVRDAGPIDAYTFFSSTPQRFRLEGLDLPDLGVVNYSDKNIWVNFPLSFNETQTDDFVGTYNLTVEGFNVTANRTGSLTTKYDGFGTLILPGGTQIQNVRRLKLDQVVDDVISVSGISVTTTVETTTYIFFAQGERRHVFQFTLGETTVSPPGQVVSSAVASYLGDAGGQNPPPMTATRRGAHLTAQNGSFESEILIHNPEMTQQTLSLHPLDGDGGALAAVDVTVAGLGTSRSPQQNYFSTAAQSFSVEGCDSCIFSVGYRANIPDASTAQVHQAERFENEFYFYPGEWEYLFDGAAIINAGDAAADITATQLSDDGDVLATVTLEESLAPGGKHLRLFNDLFTNTPESIIRLNSTQPMAVMILRISTDGRFLYHNLPLPEQPGIGVQRWLAHITSETGGFDTDVYIHNTSDSDRTSTFHTCAEDGTPLDVVSVTVPGNSTRRFAKTDLFDPDTSHAFVTGPTDSLVTLGYRSRVPDSSTAMVHEAPPVGTSFTIYPGEWSQIFDGLAMVNLGNDNAAITLKQIGDNGQELNSVVLTGSLAPHAKYLNVLEGLIPENSNSILVVESTQPLALLSLRLSKDSRYLYENPPLPQE